MRREKASERMYALYLSLYWMSACFVYGYTRLFLSRLGFSADQVGLVLAVGAQTFTVANGGNGVGGSIDFMEINGGGFTPYTLRNKWASIARSPY